MMKYKRYEAPTLQQAILKMTIDLGKDAILVSHRTTRKGGLFGLFGKKVVEVTGALPSRIKNPSTSSPEVKPSITSPSKVKGNNPQGDEINEIQRELQEIKQRMEIMFEEMKVGVSSKYPGKSGELYMRLIQSEVEEGLAEDLIKKIIAESSSKELEDKSLLQHNLERCIMDLIEVSGPIKLDSHPKVVILVGPTGVGKTTTLAKLAADFAFEKDCKVALITIDTYRIAAVEQLKTYAEILGVPLHIVFSPQEFGEAIRQLENFDLILVDTAGRSQRNHQQMQELKIFIENCGFELESILLLSATTKYKEMLDITESFKKVSFNKILFTKLDETVTFGPILNILTKVPKPLCYVTLGQNVPEDIEVADPKKIARLILEEQK
ncbi:MAG: flagellar biosynthesis protein FlhF [bacterium]|nr:flagellar biosynthesis protein FlhF [bacterium]